MAVLRMDVPIGTVLDFAGAAIPDGYLECDGSAVSRTAYPLLFAAIGTAWGAGDGSTTFNLPNLGGRATIGKGGRNVGDTGGSETHTLTTDELPSHKHSVGAHAHGLNSHTHSVGAHKHTVPAHGHGFTRPTVSSSGYVKGGITGGSHSHMVDSFYYANYSGSQAAFHTTNWEKHANVGVGTKASTHTHDLPNHTHTLTGGSVSDKAAFDTNNSTAFNSGAASGNTANSAAFDSGAAGGGLPTASCSHSRSSGRSYAPPRRYDPN